MSFMISSDHFINELVFTTSRSSGPGGQNVNKVNSKVTLRWHIAHSQSLNDAQKEVIQTKLHSRINKDGFLVLTSQEERSQAQNKEDALSKLDALLLKIFTPKKKRKATRPSKGAKQKRLDSKKQQSEKKQQRQKY